MRIQSVTFRQYGRYAALRPIACTVLQGFLGDQTHLLVVGQLERQRQSGEAASNYKCVELQQFVIPVCVQG